MHLPTAARRRTRIGLVASACAALLAGAAFAVPRAARGDSTPIGPLPAGPTSTITTAPRRLVAIALPRSAKSSGLSWRIARAFDAKVVREVTEADVGSTVVVVYRAGARGRATLRYALTRGDTSPKAVAAATFTIVVR